VERRPFYPKDNPGARSSSFLESLAPADGPSREAVNASRVGRDGNVMARKQYQVGRDGGHPPVAKSAEPQACRPTRNGEVKEEEGSQ
jgi:hypothetical protein